MTQPFSSTQSLTSRLSLPLFLQNALTKAGFTELSDFEGCDAEELAADLRIGSDVAEDLLRQVELLKAGPSRTRAHPSSFRPSNSARPSQTVASLLPLARTAESHNTEPTTTSNFEAWSTGSSTIDLLLSSYTAVSTFNDLPRVISSNAVDVTQQLQKVHKIPQSEMSGVRRGMILEVASPPGGGKSSFVIGVALRARLDADGEAEVLLLDSEGSLTPSRIRSAAEQLCQSMTVSASALLSGVHLIRAATQTEMLAFWHTLDDWLMDHPKVKLVVIDTLSYHYRHPGMDTSSRKRLMEIAKQRLAKASTVFGCAVIVTNQMATKLLTNEGKLANFDTGDRAVLMPQAGDQWMTPKTIRMVLFRRGQGGCQRYAHVQGAPGRLENQAWAAFDIDCDGMIQDVIE